jgi:trans-aconitate 2-methyltransferase
MTAEDYYDDFADHQARVGINARHRAIDRWLGQFGLGPGMAVLEIGCGIGTQTELIVKRLRGSGTLTAVDLSPRSIDFARRRLDGHRNVDFIAGDIVELELGRTYDVVVMPDVIEHIPLDQHLRLFSNVRRWLRETGWALIHMPNPFYLDWCRHNRPDVLQVIDQPIFTGTLVSNTQPNDLYVHHLQTYAIWVAECDYQVVVLRPTPRHLEFGTPTIDRSLRSRLRAILTGIVGVSRRLRRGTDT